MLVFFLNCNFFLNFFYYFIFFSTKINENDEDFWKIANAEADNDISDYELNWKTLKPMLKQLLDSDEFDVNLLDLWDGISDISKKRYFFIVI